MSGYHSAKAHVLFFTTIVCRVAPYRGRRRNRISRVVARLTHFGSAVSLLTPKCLLGARHVVHEIQTSVLVARAGFVLRYWCASPSPSFRPTILTASFRFLQREWTVAAMWTYAQCGPRSQRHTAVTGTFRFPLRASWRAAPRSSPSHASWRGQCRVLTRFLSLHVVSLHWNANRN